MTLQALIFDVDGTLAETEEIHRAAFNAAFVAAGLDWHWTVADYTELLRTTGGKERMAKHRANIGATQPDDATIKALHLDKTARYTALMAAGISLRPGVQALMDQARAAGLRLAIATTTSVPNVEALAQAVWGKPVDQVFDVVCAGDQVPAKKPAPDVYLLALERLGLGAHQAIALEDTRNGVQSATRAGLAVVVTPSLYSAGEDFTGAARIVPDLTHLTLKDARALIG